MLRAAQKGNTLFLLHANLLPSIPPQVLKTLFFCQPDLPLTNDILMTKTKTGITPAHVAAQFDCFEALRFLARCGCDMEARDELDETPAHKAARNNSQVCLKFLKSKMGVDMHCENKETDTPADLTQMCTRHNQSSNTETGPTQVHSQRLVKLEEKVRLGEGEWVCGGGIGSSN